MDNKIFITGVKHCGKSTIGKRLSIDLNIPFFDLDDIIEESVKMGVREFYIKEGRERFLEEEANAVDYLNQKSEAFICATGGGICDNQAAFSKIKKSGLSIYIDEEFNTIFDRIKMGGIPAFLTSDDPEKEFFNIYQRRKNLYKKSANITVIANSRIPNIITKDITTQLKEHNSVR